MRKQWAIPVLASILILGTLGLSQDVFAQTNAGKILVVDAGSNYLFLIDSSTGARTILSDFSDTSQGPLASNPFAVEIDNSGNILVVDFGFGVNSNGALFKIDPTTGARTILSDFSDISQGPLGLGPNGVTVDSAGNIFVTDQFAPPGFGGALFKIDPTTGARTILSDFKDPSQGPVGEDPFGVRINSAGKILVTDQALNFGGLGGLFKVDPTTGVRTLFSDFSDLSQGPLGSDPNGIDINSSGDVIIGDTTGFNFSVGAIFSVDPSSGIRTVLSDFADSSQGQLARLPVGLAIDASGDIIVVAREGATIGSRGQILSIDPTTGVRTLLSDFSDFSQGPLGSDPFDVAIFSINEEPPSDEKNNTCDALNKENKAEQKGKAQGKDIAKENNECN